MYVGRSSGGKTGATIETAHSVGTCTLYMCRCVHMQMQNIKHTFNNFIPFSGRTVTSTVKKTKKHHINNYFMICAISYIPSSAICLPVTHKKSSSNMSQCISKMLQAVMHLCFDRLWCCWVSCIVLSLVGVVLNTTYFCVKVSMSLCNTPPKHKRAVLST